MVIVESNSVCNQTSDNKVGRKVRFVCREYYYRRIGGHEVLLPINNKNYNNTKVRKGKIYIKSFHNVSMVIEYKVLIVWLNYNLKWDWLI